MLFQKIHLVMRISKENSKSFIYFKIKIVESIEKAVQMKG